MSELHDNISDAIDETLDELGIKLDREQVDAIAKAAADAADGYREYASYGTPSWGDVFAEAEERHKRALNAEREKHERFVSLAIESVRAHFGRSGWQDDVTFTGHGIVIEQYR